MHARLAAFVEIARHGALGPAAHTLHLTQPALTARLQRLEQEVGGALFVRTGRGMRLTEAGRAFLPYAERALAAVAEGIQVVQDAGSGRAGHLRIGAAPAVSTYVLPAVLKRFALEHPDVQLSVRTGHSEEVLEMVVHGTVQVGLVRALRSRDVESTPFYQEELLLVTDPDHPFAADGQIRIEQLGDEELILFDRTSSYHELTSALFRVAGVSPRGVMELDNIDAAKKMVQLGLGVALLPHTAVTEEVQAGTLAAVQIVGASAVRRQIVAIRRQDAGPASGPLQGFLDVLDALRPQMRLDALAAGR